MPKRVFKEILVHDGFALRFEKNISNGKQLFYCTKRKTSTGCHAYAHRDGNGLIVLQREHERHEANDDRAKAEVIKRELVRKAESNSDPPRDMIHNIRLKYGPTAVSMAGSVEALSHRVQRARQSGDVVTSLANANPPSFIGSMTELEDGSRFIIFDQVCQITGSRSVCFATDTQLEALEKTDLVCEYFKAMENVIFQVLVDGTFEVVPEPFEQLWIIHGNVSPTASLPMIFVLMQGKTTADYSDVLESIKKCPLLQNWDPKHLMADLETAEQKAFLDAFPSVQEHYCLFHVLQSWRRKLQTLGLSKQIVYGKEFYEFWSLLRCLPFGDPALVESDFDEIQKTLPAPLTQSMQKFVNYIKRYYIGNSNSNCKFPVSHWNVQMNTLSSMPRTSNSVESSHRNISGCVRICQGRRKVKMADLFSCLRKEASKFEMDLEAISKDPNYQVLHKRKVGDVLKDKRLFNVVQNNPQPPNQPLSGLDYYKAIRAAWKC